MSFQDTAPYILILYISDQSLLLFVYSCSCVCTIIFYGSVTRVYFSLVPDSVNINDVTCNPRNLINQCDVGWNVSEYIIIVVNCLNIPYSGYY